MQVWATKSIGVFGQILPVLICKFQHDFKKVFLKTNEIHYQTLLASTYCIRILKCDLKNLDWKTLKYLIFSILLHATKAFVIIILEGRVKNIPTLINDKWPTDHEQNHCISIRININSYNFF